MRVIKVTGAVRELDIENTPAAFRCALGGHFLGVIRMNNGSAMIFDKEARLSGAVRNEIASITVHDDIFGAVLVVGTNDEDYCDVPDNVAKSFKDLLQAVTW